MSFATAPDSVFGQIRNNFLNKYKSNIEKGVYHPKDIDRIKADSNWLRAFYKHSLMNSDRTVDMVNDVLKWRKDFNCNELLTPGKLPVPEELFKKGALFKRNEDLQCNPLLHFVVKTHKKDQYPHEQVCRFIAFFFEKNYKFNIDDPVVLLLDMSDAGYSNLDMDMIKFIVNCLKTYYPGLIDYMIVYQMPFIFNAAWKIIKNWLPPEAIKLIKFVDKKSIKELVHETQLSVHMGGTDTYKYTYIRDEHVVKAQIEAFQSVSEFEQYKSIEPSIQVHESIKEEVVEDNSIKIESSSKEITETSSMKSKRHSKMGAILAKNAIIPNELNTFNSSLLSICPGDELTFNIDDGKTDIIQYIKLINNTEFNLAYKIKITSPDKFRVKPGTGLISGSGTAQIMVNFLKEYQTSNSNQRDKFLILWTQVDEKMQTNELNEFWKQVSQKKSNINEHKVKCIVLRPNETKANDSSFVEQSVISEEVSSKANKILGDQVVVVQRKNTTATKTESVEFTGLTVEDKNYINLKLYNLDKNVNEVLANQQKILKNSSLLLNIAYFLVLLNIIQILFQSNLFTQVIEPYIDFVLFQKKQ
ncbi:unnamed protein product [Brachionus calyciflorus]|uniref:Motile sperm domain-containing protein 2 n=1 Tax=Brachionus calyciflorus TaxID=104777 RepID=A0A813NZG4_9BILA|nr:unnamed protein product [Brachionus calyciflorus]